MSVHPTAIIEDGARIDDSAEIGPYCHIGAHATIAEGTRLISHVVVAGDTTIGARSSVHPFAVLGGPPQHLGYKGERTRLTIGAGALIREHVTMNLGTIGGGGETRIGVNGTFMTGAHVAHDCIVGDNVVFANNATLGGHVEVGDYAFLGGLCAIHQFCRVGDNAFVGGCAAAPTDIIPYGSATGNHAHLSGLNIIGMKRRGMDRQSIHAVRGAYRMLFDDEDNFADRLEKVADAYREVAAVMQIVDFVRAGSRRPIMTPER